MTLKVAYRSMIVAGLFMTTFIYTSCSDSHPDNSRSDTTIKTVTKLENKTPSKLDTIKRGSIYTISSDLCINDQGPDCTELRLGDEFFTTSKPTKGYLYSCVEKNPKAPGSVESKITWINFIEKTWNYLKKPWLPNGEFNPGPGIYQETIKATVRILSGNNLPVDGAIGDWPMTKYAKLTEIDPNPGIPKESSYTFSYPMDPLESDSPFCVSPGPIGVTKNGVVIYNASDARGEDAVAREIVDEFGGHPARKEYHYHFIPERLDKNSLGDGHSGIVGYIHDGFPIYGYRGENGIEMSNDTLDICHGHNHGKLGYHYHATIEFPYTIGCYRGLPISNSSITERPKSPPRRHQ